MMRRYYSAKSSGDGGGDNDDDDDEEIISTESSSSITITKLLATPIKVLPNKKPIALVYPLVLLGASAFLPASTAVILDAFFAGFWLLGRNVIGEDDDTDDGNINDYDSELLSMSNMIDLTALAGAIVSAGLLSPDPISNEATNNFFGEGLGVTAIALAAAAVGGAIASENDDVASGSAAVDTQTRKEVIDPIQQEMLDSWDRKLRGGDISEGLSKDEQGSSRNRRR